MRRLFGCPDIVSLTDKFLMARNVFFFFSENIKSRYVGQQNLLYSRSEGMLNAFSHIFSEGSVNNIVIQSTAYKLFLIQMN